MSVTIDAVFEHGVFRPLQPVGFDEGTRVEVIVRTAPGPANETPRQPRFGFATGMFEMRDDFNDPLDEFAEYR